MAYRNCFKKPNDNLNSGQYISRKKSRTIFKASVDLANNGGVYHKKTESGQDMGTYVGDVNISRDGKKCLIGATSYDTLLSVTNGKYLEQPTTFDFPDSEDLWTGSIYRIDLSGVVSIVSYPDGSANTFSYPPFILANQLYPKLNPPSDQGLVVDPCYNLFYPNDMGTDRNDHSVCYVNDERAYEQYRKVIPLTETYVKNYIGAKNGFVGEYYYPRPFTFDCCNNYVASITETTRLTGANGPTDSISLTTFTLTDGNTQTRAATSEILTVPSSIPISNIVSVSVGTDVTSIGDYAFYDASALTSITIPSSVISIGNYAFYGASKLTSVTFAEGSKLTRIGASAFQGASSLTSVTIPTSVTSIGLNALLYSVPATLTTTTLSGFSIPTKTVGDSPFQITAPTTNSNGAFTYSSSNTAVASVSGTTITIVGAGSSTITASQAATANYTSITITASLVVNTATTTLSGFSIPTKTVGDSPFQITAPTSNSTGAFTYSSSNTAVASVSGTTVTIVGAGSSIITANQAETANYTSKTITAPLVVNTATTTLSNFSVPTKTVGDSPFQITAPTSNSTGAFTYSSSNTAVASVSGTTITIVGAGSSTITATQAETANYTSKTITATLVVNTATTTLSGFLIPTKTVGDSPFQITAPTSNSTGAFTYSSSNTAVASVSGTTVTIVGAGSSTITASQAATANYTSKTITAPLVVNTATTTLSGFLIPTKTFGDSSFQITAPTSNSTGAFTYSSSNTAVASVSGTTVTIVGAGSSTITASQAATANYISKTITAPLVVNTATTTLSNFSVPTKTVGDSPFTITQPTSNNSTGAFTYSSSNTAVATVAGTTITIVGAGSSTITASQAATANYTSKTITAPLVVNTATTPATATTFTLTDGTTQTTAATSGTLTVPTSIPISSIKSVIVGTDVTSIGIAAFQRATALTSITIPSSVTSIEGFVFYGATALTSIIIPASVTSIGQYAFYGASRLASITIPATVTSIEQEVFGGTSSLTSVIFAEGSILNNIAFRSFYQAGLTSIIIPASVTSIGESAFDGASKLTSVTFAQGSKLNSISQSAFKSPKLTSITIPSGVTSIGTNAFTSSGLTSVIFESSSNLLTLNVSIGSNPTFFGSGAVTVSIAPELEFSLYFLNNGTSTYNFAQQFTTKIQPNTIATFEIILTGSDEILKKFYSAPSNDSSTNSEKWYKISELQDINNKYSIVNVITSTSDTNGLVTFLFTGIQREIDNWTRWWDQIGYIFMNLALFPSGNTSITTNGMTITFKVTESNSGITKITTSNGSDFYNLIKASPVIDNSLSNYINFGVNVSKYVKINL